MKIKQIRSVHHLISISKKNGAESLQNIRLLDKKIWFDIYGIQTDSSIDFFVQNLKKYGVTLQNIHSIDTCFLLTCSVEELEHTSLIKNIKNITKRYNNAKEVIIKHKKVIDIKVQYYKEMTWRKNQKKFENELNRIELEKFNIYLEYGVGVFKLE